MQTASLWLETAEAPRFSPLAADLEVEVVVVGGGITGLTTAYLLDREGVKVALLERKQLMLGESGHTTAHLTCVTDARLGELVKRFGKDHATAVWDAGLAAILQIEQIVRDTGIDCDFQRVPGFLVAAIGADVTKETDSLRDEAKLAAELGFDAVYLDAVPGLNRPGYRVANQAKFHLGKYLAGLARVLQQRGVPVYEESEASEFHDEPRWIGVNGHRVACRQVVLATHALHGGFETPLNRDLLQTKLAAYNTYAVSATIPEGRLPEALYWDTNEPYYYLRVEGGRIVWGGEDHKTGQEEDTTARFAALERSLRELLPEAEVDYRWSGQVLETNDGLPFIGQESPVQFLSTGFSGNGMTFGTLAAMMARDEIRGTRNPWRNLFTPGRKTLAPGSVWDYLSENKDYPYYLLKGRFSRGESVEVAEVQPGEGRVLAIDGRKVAVYRAEDGSVKRLSPVCPHLGCTVAWNTAEQTWDCPCHGSRFTGAGELMTGPAESSLAPADG